MVIVKLKTEAQTIYREPQRKVTKLISKFYILGSEQPGSGATLLGWPKSIYYMYTVVSRRYKKQQK